MNTSKNYKIRPAGRHILTIGKDLIQDKYAAIIELVKNAYDADSPSIEINFKADGNKESYSITISDHGHGMSYETVIHKWMVPSTDDKIKRRMSPQGRIMQGRKGVGRYAASVLGRDMLLETVTYSGEKTIVYIDWKDFETAQYLDDVEILVETTNTNQQPGTKLTIKGDHELLADWDEDQFKKLRFELKKLTSPRDFEKYTGSSGSFTISLKFEGFQSIEDIDEIVEPYPIIDMYDYMIRGYVNADGTGLLTYSMQKIRNTIEEDIPFNFGGPTGCGDLLFDIRVYDREKESIESLIGRGLKDITGRYVGMLQARQLLNEYNGIGVYRNGFRIRPLGDADFDWLKLNEQRVQNPSMRIGSNQAIGYVQIQSEENSSLIEKSARDGLKENAAYKQLKSITKSVIAKLEEKRFEFRKKAGLSRPILKVEQEFEKLFSFDDLERNIRSKLSRSGINKKVTDEIIDIITREKNDKNKIVEEIRQAVAIYQGQATLGKIVNVILHEGRRPLNYFRNQIPNFHYWYDSFIKTNDYEKLEFIKPIADGIGQNAETFVKLFSRLDPLAAGKRSARKPIKLKNIIKDAVYIFEDNIKNQNVTVKVSGSDEFRFLAWQQDFYAIFTNLADNSIYWMNENKSSKREITVELATEGDSLLYIDYRDTGPGIEPNLIRSEVIYEPQFSTKPGGTGLGLAIAGEAASRNGLELRAFESETGAYFRLQPKSENS